MNFFGFQKYCYFTKFQPTVDKFLVKSPGNFLIVIRNLVTKAYSKSIMLSSFNKISKKNFNRKKIGKFISIMKNQ